jgi:hypothetical protein
MKKTTLLFMLGFIIMWNIQPLDLVKVNEWSHKDEYWDVKNKSLGFKATRYWCMLDHDKVLCEDWRSREPYRRDLGDFNYGNMRYYYIKNYLTGEIIYRFENMIELYGLSWASVSTGGFVRDQYGVYIFLLKNGGLVLFDVEEKREYTPGEPLKRPEYIYYNRRNYNRTNMFERQIFKHNLATGKIEEIRFGNLNRDELLVLQYSGDYYRTLEDMGNNQLRLYDNFSDYILQLNETMTEIVSVTKKKSILEKNAEYIIPINENKSIGFKSKTWPYPLDEINGYYYILFLDENGIIQKEYQDIAMVNNDIGIGNTDMSAVCLISPDKQYVLLFYSYGTIDKEVYVYKIIYNTAGVLNDDRVRIRAEPNLSGEIKGVVNRMDKVEILEGGLEKQKIGDMESIWYRIRTAGNVEGWVFGAYIDIVE